MHSLSRDRLLARVSFDPDRKVDGRPLASALPDRLRRDGFAVGVVLRGEGGAVLDVVAESGDRIEALLGLLDDVLSEGTVTIERVHVVRYGPGSASPS
jgi:PII-like signaling protein